MLTGALRTWHPREGEDHQHDEHHQSDSHIGVAYHHQVVQTYARLLCLGEGREDDGTSGVATVRPQVGQHDKRRHAHAHERTEGVERLRQIQTACRRLLAAQREHKGIGRGLQKRQSEGKHIERDAEEGELLIRRSRYKQECAQRVERQTQHDAALVAVAAYEERRRHRHGGIAAIEGKLHKRRLAGLEFHHRLEGCHHGVGDIIGKSPEGKEGGQEHEGQEILLLH